MTTKKNNADDDVLAIPVTISQATKDIVSYYLAHEMASEFSEVQGTDLLLCGKIVLKAINSYQMKDPIAWQEENPQEDQLASEYIQRLSDYKSQYNIWSIVKKRGGKVTQLLGRNFLKVIFEEVEDEILNNEQNQTQSSPSIKTLDQFLVIFREELSKPDSFFWSGNFVEHMKQRTQERVQKAKERVEQQQEEEGSSGQQRSVQEKLTQYFLQSSS
eukprot:c12954_g1_i1.p1 GENE.c12954_g1_i1~~c12954_g1_i1.p1  ORF type:complete len:216 (-),score=85.73 c12954_g1_i1:93-740(-)